MDEVWRNTWRAFFGLKPRPTLHGAPRSKFTIHPIPPEPGYESRLGPEGAAALAHEAYGYSISAAAPPNGLAKRRLTGDRARAGEPGAGTV
jgi:hypothetical protein